MADIKYEVRLMRKEDVPQTLDIWRETGMQEGTNCFYTWLQVDPEGISIAVKDTGEIIGVCSAIIHHEDLVFVGAYAVREKYRGCGVGFKVWKACMDHIGSRNAALNAVPDKVELYRDKGGFPLEEKEWVNLVNETSENVKVELLSDNIPSGVEIKPYQHSFLPSMLEYDVKLMGYKRDLALKLNCEEGDSRSYVAFKDGTCVGFGTVKISCQNLAQVGPLYADDPAVAEVMLKKLILSLPQVKGFAMMTISSNTHANDLIQRLGCPTTEECPRLCSKRSISVDTNKVFGHFDLNFSPF